MNAFLMAVNSFRLIPIGCFMLGFTIGFVLGLPGIGFVLRCLLYVIRHLLVVISWLE